MVGRAPTPSVCALERGSPSLSIRAAHGQLAECARNPREVGPEEQPAGNVSFSTLQVPRHCPSQGTRHTVTQLPSAPLFPCYKTLSFLSAIVITPSPTTGADPDIAH